MLPFRKDNQRLLVGGEVGAHHVDRQAVDDLLGDLAPIAGGEHDALDTGLAEAPQEVGHARAQTVGEDEFSGGLAINRDRNHHRTRRNLPIRSPVGARSGAGDNEAAAADRELAPVDQSLDALAGGFLDTGRRTERQPLGASLRHEGSGDDVLRGLVERRGKAQQFVAGHPGSDVDRHQAGAAVGEGSGLVDDEAAHPRQRLQRLAALDQDAVAGGARETGNDRDRHREDQRARGRHHQDGDGADRITGPEPGNGGDGDRHAEKAERELVGQAGHGCLRALGGLNQADDAGIGALRRGACGEHVEGLAGIGRTAHQRLAGRVLDGERLAGQCRLVHHGDVVDDGTVDGDDIALADEKPVARRHDVEGDLLQPGGTVAHGGAGHARKQRGHLPAGVTLGEILEVLAAGVHQRNHRRGEVFAEGDRSRHRQGGDDVEADVAAPEADDDLDQQEGEDRERRSGPNPARGAIEAEKPCGKAEDQAGGR